jgi:hypothetical protein
MTGPGQHDHEPQLPAAYLRSRAAGGGAALGHGSC